MSQSHTTHNAWERWAWIWSVVFFGSFAPPILVLYLEGMTLADAWTQIYLLTAGAFLVHWIVIWGLPRLWSAARERQAVGVVYILILTGIVGQLINIHPVFSFALGGYFSQIFFTLSMRWAIPMALAATSMLGVLALEDRSLPALLLHPTFWLWILGGVTSSMIALWINAIIYQSEERRRLIDQLERAQSELAAVEREAGILAERQRLAREIHDTLAQGFISIVTHLEAAEGGLDSDTTVARHHLIQARQMARSSLGEARRFIQDLRPEVLEGSSLPTAFERIAAQWTQSSGVRATVTTTGHVQTIHPEVEVTLLRVLQEALANVRKHANAGAVSITLSYMADRIVLDVQDDGDGMSEPGEPSLASSRFGLQAMRERVENLQGGLQIESEPGDGTTLVVEIPLPTVELASQLQRKMEATP